MTFRVHYTVDDVRFALDIQANSPDEARSALKSRLGNATVIVKKIKRLRH